MRAKPKNAQHLFFSGLLLSSIGSMTFTIALIVFMVRAKFSLFEVSLIIGLSRLVPVVVSTVLGDLSDRLPARQTVLWTEVAAAVSSVGILLSWQGGQTRYLPLLALCLVKAVVLALQLGSRARLVKLLSSGEYESNARTAVWFNKATQGAMFFAGMLGLVAYHYAKFEWVVVFDAATFLLNGLILLALPIAAEVPATRPRSLSFTRKFRDFYSHNPRAAKLDLALAMTMMGTASFNTRLAGPEQAWNVALVVAYGLAVWVAGWIEQSQVSKKLNGMTLWSSLALSFVLLGLISDTPGPSLVLLSFTKDIVTWILMHRISAHIQADTPHAIFGSVSHARNAQLVSIIAVGELVVGSWQGILPLAWESYWRAALCAVVALVLLFSIPALRPRYAYERPSL